MKQLPDSARFMPVSIQSTRLNRTGSWRYLTPVFEVKASPCECACPLAVPIAEFIHELAGGRPEEAASLIRMENPLPSVCGRVCVHPCEDGCNRSSYDRSVAVHMLERFAGDRYPYARVTFPGTISGSVAIVGAGPAGISAAYFLRMLGHRVSIYEADTEAGGMLKRAIPEYRLPSDVLTEAIEQILGEGIELNTRVKLGENLSMDDLSYFNAVFIATGAGRGKKAGFEDSETSGVVSGLELLKGIRTGQMQSAPKKTAVIGGGNTALDCARSLLRMGSHPVILYRREIQDMPAFGQEVKEAQREGVEIRTGVIVREVISSEGAIIALRCVHVRQDKDFRDTFHEIEGSGFVLEADLAVVAAGEEPDMDVLPKGIMHAGSKATVNAYGMTSLPNVFAGGDLIDQPHLVAHAMASGKRAAVGIDAKLMGLDAAGIIPAITLPEAAVSFRVYLRAREHLLNKGELVPAVPSKVSRYKDINLSYFTPMDRLREPKLALAERAHTFREVHAGCTETAALREALRCFTCGKCILCDTCVFYCPDISMLPRESTNEVDVDYDYCKGCGICAEECPRGVITMERVVLK